MWRRLKGGREAAAEETGKVSYLPQGEGGRLGGRITASSCLLLSLFLLLPTLRAPSSSPLGHCTTHWFSLSRFELARGDEKVGRGQGTHQRSSREPVTSILYKVICQTSPPPLFISSPYLIKDCFIFSVVTWKCNSILAPNFPAKTKGCWWLILKILINNNFSIPETYFSLLCTSCFLFLFFCIIFRYLYHLPCSETLGPFCSSPQPYSQRNSSIPC